MATVVNDLASDFANNVPPASVAALISPQEKPYKPNSPRSRYLYERGFEPKAKAYDCCGSFAREWYCSKHNKILAVERYTCHQRYCARCGQHIARVRLDNSEKAIRQMRLLSAGHARTLCFITVTTHCEARAEMLNRFWKTVFGPLKKVVRKRAGPYFLQGHLCGYDDKGKLVWRAISWSGEGRAEVFKSTLKAAIPDAEVKVVVRDISQMHQLFARLFVPLIPRDAIEQARLEIAFTGVDQLRTSQALKRFFPKDSSNERGETLGSNVAHHDSPAHAKRCPECGKLPDCVTEWHPQNIPQAERAALRRYGPGEKPPPPRYPWH